MQIDPNSVQWDDEPATAPASQFPGVIRGVPSASKAREEVRKDEDQSLQRAQFDLSVQSAERAEKAADRAEVTASRLSVSDTDDIRRKVSAFGKLLRSAQEFQDDYSNTGAGLENFAQAWSPVDVGTAGQRDWWSEFKSADNLIRNELFGASLSAGEKGAYGETTVEPGMNPKEVRTNIGRRVDEARGEMQRIVNSLYAGGYSKEQIDAALGDYKPLITGEKPLTIGAKEPAQQQVSITGGANFSTDQDKAIAAAVQAAFQQGGGVQELTKAAEAAGGQVRPEDLAAFQQAIEARDKKQAVTFNPQKSGTRSPLAQAAGEAVMTPVGTAVTGAVNAAGLGVLSQFAGDQVQGLEALNPKSAFAGEVIGSAIGTGALAAGARQGIGRVSSTLAERLAGGGFKGALARTAATDAAYGGIYAANTGEDIGTGVALGALGSLVGAGVGAGVKRASPAFRGMFRGNGDEVLPHFDGGSGGGAPPIAGATDNAAPSVPPIDEPFIPTTTRSNDAGASGTSGESMRLSQAEGLPVPVELTRGAAARDADQLAFEKEQIFGPLGAPLRTRAEENNTQVLQNFDRFIDLTGAQAPDIAATGNAVTKALSEGYKQAKDRVNVAYRRAEAAGDMAEPISYKEIADFIAEQTPTTREKLAPVLNAVSEQLRKNDPDGTGQIPINALEDVRKLINKATTPGTADANYGGELKGLIDQATEGKGGALYKKARALRIEQARKFENRAVVERLVASVKNKADAKTESNKVFERSILNESPEDIKFLRHALKTSGPEGRQAWKELQGATVRHIQESATANVNLTSSNEKVVSAAGLNKVVEKLDKNGRLDAIFDPATAQRIRDLRDVVQYVNTVPPGTSINNSGTARHIGALLADMTAGGALTAYMTGTPVPVPAVAALKAIKSGIRDNRIKKKIAQSLMPRGE